MSRSKAKAGEQAKTGAATAETTDKATETKPTETEAPEAKADETPEAKADETETPEAAAADAGELAANEARGDATKSAVTSPDPAPALPVNKDPEEAARAATITPAADQPEGAKPTEVETPAQKDPAAALLEAPAPRQEPEGQKVDDPGAVTLPEAAVTRMSGYGVGEVRIADDNGEPVKADEAFTEPDGSGEVLCLTRLVEHTVAQPFNRPVEVLLCAAGTRLPEKAANEIVAKLRAQADSE